MNKTLIRRALAGAALASLGLAANAATMTLTHWTWGNGNAVAAGVPNYSGLAGGFSGTLAGAGALDGSIETYCVELTEQFSFNAAYPGYTVVSALDYFGPVGSRAARLGRLLSYVSDSNVFATAAAPRRDDQSTAVQLAVWNVVYDTDSTLASGTFRDSSLHSSATLAANGYVGASGLLAASANWTPTLNLYVLRSLGNPGQQDQIFWRRAPNDTTNVFPVSEPGGFALAGVALAALAFVRRRRG